MNFRSNKRGEQLNIKPRGFENKRKRKPCLNGNLIIGVSALFLIICTCFFLIRPVRNSPTKAGKAEVIEKQLQNEKNYHLVFSTSCSDFQRWQSYLLFFHAKKISQPGRVIRIASGCPESEWQEESEWHQQHIFNKMSSDFHLHLTPSFSSVKGDGGKKVGDYKYFNKPFGLKHWIENDPQLGYDPVTKKLKNEDAIIILIDPDMVMTRPITEDFSDMEINNIIRGEKKRKVEHGSPFAQIYGLGAQWQRFDLDNIAGKDSPSKLVSAKDGNTFYPAGPPYVATARDMHNIAITWSEFAPKVHAEYPYLLAEMYAYCIAAAHLKLPHQMVSTLMVSDVGSGPNGEGWGLVDLIPDDDVCSASSSERRTKLPNVLHYCQRYILGKWMFAKHRVPKKYFECDRPFLVSPPTTLSTDFDYAIPPGESDDKKTMVKENQRKHVAFMVCSLTKAMNEAAAFYKNHHCDNPNLGYSAKIWEM